MKTFRERRTSFVFHFFNGIQKNLKAPELSSNNTPNAIRSFELTRQKSCGDFTISMTQELIPLPHLCRVKPKHRITLCLCFEELSKAISFLRISFEKWKILEVQNC